MAKLSEEQKKQEAKIEEELEESGVPKAVAEKEAEIAEEVAVETNEKKAEAESSESAQADLEAKKKALLEKAAALKGKVEGGETDTEALKEQVRAKRRSEMLLPLEEYVKSGIYLGTRVVTPDMRQYVYRRRADGLAIFNTDLIDEKLKEGIEYLSKFNPEDIIVVCKRPAGWRAVEMFSRITGIRAFTKKYPAGILTNTQLESFTENELTLVTDAWLDKNALKDTVDVNKNVLMICDTNNFSKGANQVIIGNNKSVRSIGLIYYLLTKHYCKAKGIDAQIPELDWWTGEDETPQKAEFGV